MTAALVILRLGVRTIGRGDGFPCGGERVLRFTRAGFERLQALDDGLDRLGARLQRVLRFLHLEALAALLLVELRQLLADRLAALLRLLRALRELEVLDFQLVVLLALARELLAMAARLV